jgi:ABC-2 type transport system ATP-binding protein
MTTPAIQAKALCRIFRASGPNPFRRATTVCALNDVTFSVEAGETVAVVGRNGAGKSTLLRVLVGLALPTDGSVSVCGADATSQPAEVRRFAGFASGEDRGLYWRLTGRQNLSLFGALHDITGTTLSDRCTELIELVGLTDAADRPVGGYSSGMRQRLSLARAMLHRPSVLLLDEPGRSLDSDAAEQFFGFLLSTALSENRTVLFATHRYSEAASANRVLVLRGGKLVHDGPPGDAENLRALCRGDAEVL